MRYARVALLLFLGLLMVECTSSEMTYRGEPITKESHQLAAEAILVAETKSTAIIRFLMSGHEAGKVPVEALYTYLREIGPGIQAALDDSRRSLERAIDAGDERTTHDLLGQVGTLMDRVNAAARFAATYGWL